MHCYLFDMIWTCIRAIICSDNMNILYHVIIRLKQHEHISASLFVQMTWTCIYAIICSSNTNILWRVIIRSKQHEHIIIRNYLFEMIWTCIRAVISSDDMNILYRMIIRSKQHEYISASLFVQAIRTYYNVWLFVWNDMNIYLHNHLFRQYEHHFSSGVES